MRGAAKVSDKLAVPVTGASAGAGAADADRFARRGHDPVLVARNGRRTTAPAERSCNETGVAIEGAPANPTREEDLIGIGKRLRDDARIGVMANNAGAVPSVDFVDQDGADAFELIALNITAAVGFAPEIGMTLHGAAEAFVLFLSNGRDLKLRNGGVCAQAAAPAATRAEIWSRGGRDATTIPGIGEVEDSVGGALAGLGRREAVTIPSSPDASQLRAFEAVRPEAPPNSANVSPAERNRTAA